MTTLTRRAALVAALATGVALWTHAVAGSLSDSQDHDRIEAGNLVLIRPYARIMGRTAKSGGVFMGIANRGEQADRLIGVESPIAKKAAMHMTLIEDGIMKMRPLEDGVEIRAGETHAFRRGGDHIMLMGLTARPAEGETVPLTLIFLRAGRVDIEVPVDNARKPGDGATHMNMNMDSDG